MQKIVILDAATVSGDSAVWRSFAKLGEVEIYESTEPHEVAERCSDAWAVLTNKVPVSEDVMQHCKSLRYIGVLATGYNIVDIEAARRFGITVTNIPGYSTASVAQLVFALLLELTNNAGGYNAAVSSGRWENSKLFSFRLAPIIELDGLTMGIYGFGTIGQQVARIAHAFGMKVVTPSKKRLPDWVSRVDLPDFWSRADVISINAAFTPDQANLICRHTLSLMKPTAYLINTARGGFVDEAALAEALETGRIAGAGIDVLSQEPPRNGSPLIGLKKCVVTPHVGWQSTQALNRLMKISCENLRSFVEGNPVNVVN